MFCLGRCDRTQRTTSVTPLDSVLIQENMGQRKPVFSHISYSAVIYTHNLTILTGKNCFIQFSTRIFWNRSFAVFELFHMFSESNKVNIFYCHILKSADVWTRWFINPWSSREYNESNNERLLLSATFTTKFQLVFVLTQENALCKRLNFKGKRKSISSPKIWYQGFSKKLSVWEICMFLCDNPWKIWTFSVL